ncbi:diguanylate cyclase domain-containing protein [Marinicellulosiphila megalodicopiae]|uniref:diguanylate cyclase domain-containing protein n=1 Tax=Marinicellulosiphila megalodicopiae TaxID=2724896 RepID=UPI003BAEEFE0
MNDTNYDNFLLNYQKKRVTQLYWLILISFCLIDMVAFYYAIKLPAVVLFLGILVTAPIYLLLTHQPKWAFISLVCVLMVIVQIIFWLGYGLKAIAVYGFPILLILTIFFNQTRLFWLLYSITVVSFFTNSMMYELNILNLSLELPSIERAIVLVLSITLFSFLLRFFYSDSAMLIRNLKQEQERLNLTKQQLTRFDHYDPLTQLSDRLFAKDFYEISINNKLPNEFIAICYIDLDKFKQLNDAYGYEFGDQFLHNISKTLVSCIEKDDGIFKVGGDEFLLILTKNRYLDDLDFKLFDILRQISQPFSIKEKLISIHCSMGVSITPKDGIEFEKLLAKSDLSMVEAKRNGGSRFEIYQEQMQSKQQRKLKIIQSIDQLMTQKSITLNFIPIHLVSTEQVFGFKIELKAQHDGLGTLPQQTLFESLQQSRKFSQLWRWKIVEIQNMMQMVQNQGFYNLDICITAPTQLLLNGQISSILHEQWHEFEWPFNHVVLLLEESIFNESNKGVFENIGQLHRLGVRFAVSSLSYTMTSLNRLKLDFLEFVFFEEALITEGKSNTIDQIMQHSILRMIHALHLKSCIELSETQLNAAQNPLSESDCYLKSNLQIDSKDKLVRYLFEHNSDILYGVI